MAITNHERVGKALDTTTAALKPFVQRELKTTLGEKREDAVREIKRDD